MIKRIVVLGRAAALASLIIIGTEAAQLFGVNEHGAPVLQIYMIATAITIFLIGALALPFQRTTKITIVAFITAAALIDLASAITIAALFI
ncbi:MAG: hypothetical protein Q7S12_02875 [bacterium]|nr:hypothetical protein [bacterium]